MVASRRRRRWVVTRGRRRAVVSRIRKRKMVEGRRKRMVASMKVWCTCKRIGANPNSIPRARIKAHESKS